MNILALTFWSYKSGLIQTYTLPYLKIIANVLPENSKIYLLTMEKENLAMDVSEREEVKAKLAQNGITLIPFKYHRFGVIAIIKWIWILIYLFITILIRDIKAIHSFCMPPSVAGSILSFSTGRKLIVDSYEPHAEASLENGDWRENSFAFKFLLGFEKVISKRAFIIISATEGMRQYAYEKYGVDFKKFFVKPACVDLNLFQEKNRKQTKLLKELKLEDKIVAVYAGKFGGIYLDQEVFDYFKIAQDYWGDKFRVLVLTNQPRQQLVDLAQNSGFDLDALCIKFVLHTDIPDYIGLGDFGITPVKPIPTKRYCTPIKNGEYWALGLPIVSTANISDDSEIIEKKKIGSIIHEFTDEAFLKSVKEIDAILKSETKENLFHKIRKVAVEYRSFDIAEKIYEKIYGKNGILIEKN